MFCTVLKGREVASEIIRILLLGLLLVQRAASLMSNDLDTNLTSWHGHKPSWHCQPPLETDNIGFCLGYLQGSGKQVNHLPFFSCSCEIPKIKANYMPQIKYQTTNDIYYSGNVSIRFHFPIAFFAQNHQYQRILFDHNKRIYSSELKINNIIRR